VDENEFFRQATLRISGSLNVETALQRFFVYLKEFVPIGGMFFALYDPHLHLGRMLASIWPDHLPKPADFFTPPRQFKDFLKRNWNEDAQVRVVNDIDREYPESRALFTTLWPADTSVISMDLELEARRLGRFTLFAEGRHRYRPEHARLLSLLHEPLAVAISNMLQHEEISRLKDMLADDNRYLHRQMLQMTGDTIVGAEFGLREVMEMVRQVAPLHSPVLLMGETGVGKEIIANALHASSARRGGPYITVNCGAIPEALIDSELFGHEKGAFTGAIARKRGRFERAHGGTIFLDEIGELPAAAQVRLLRVVQHQVVERVGGTAPIGVDVRIISATHRNLEAMVRSGTFREDLWFRLNVFPIMIPPLRRRLDDIPALVRHFIERKARELKIGDLPSLAPGALERLQAYHWPGNVRELENLVERALIQYPFSGGAGGLTFDALMGPAAAAHAGASKPEEGSIAPLDQVVAAHIRKALEHARGRVEGPRGAAALLGLNPSTLRARMRKLGVAYGRHARNRNSGHSRSRPNRL
jgi:transcriptional regulator with GAF, ATPase, and Fis domain